MGQEISPHATAGPCPRVGRNHFPVRPISCRIGGEFVWFGDATRRPAAERGSDGAVGKVLIYGLVDVFAGGVLPVGTAGGGIRRLRT
jgi:hypothetical protein